MGENHRLDVEKELIVAVQVHDVAINVLILLSLKVHIIIHVVKGVTLSAESSYNR